MKKALTGSVIVLLVLFLSAGLGMAGNGKGSGQGPGGGTGPIHDIFAGTPFTVTGDVITAVAGGGLELAPDPEDETANVIIYGIGSVRYWDSLGIDHPCVGDTLTVVAYPVDYNGVLRNIAVTIIIDGVPVELRDPDTGAPLWRGRNLN
ncbi:MAG: hypothetical protein K9N10_09265 [Deltaproteobacteria bacterium]|nr:hypothetical protein [Deltaproteobacteria bacterium]